MMFFKFHHKGEGTKLGWLSETHKQWCKSVPSSQRWWGWEDLSWEDVGSRGPPSPRLSPEAPRKNGLISLPPLKNFHPSVLSCLNWLECSGHGLVVLPRDLLKTPVFAGICICDVLWKIIQTIEFFRYKAQPQFPLRPSFFGLQWGLIMNSAVAKILWELVFKGNSEGLSTNHQIITVACNYKSLWLVRLSMFVVKCIWRHV